MSSEPPPCTRAECLAPLVEDCTHGEPRACLRVGLAHHDRALVLRARRELRGRCRDGVEYDCSELESIVDLDTAMLAASERCSTNPTLCAIPAALALAAGDPIGARTVLEFACRRGYDCAALAGLYTRGTLAPPTAMRVAELSARLAEDALRRHQIAPGAFAAPRRPIFAPPLTPDLAAVLARSRAARVEACRAGDVEACDRFPWHGGMPEFAAATIAKGAACDRGHEASCDAEDCHEEDVERCARQRRMCALGVSESCQQNWWMHVDPVATLALAVTRCRAGYLTDCRAVAERIEWVEPADARLAARRLCLENGEQCVSAATFALAQREREDARYLLEVDCRVNGGRACDVLWYAYASGTIPELSPARTRELARATLPRP